MTLSSVRRIGLRRSPEPAVFVLSPLSLALLSLTRLDRLSRLLTPWSESIERFGECEPLTAFLRCRCAACALEVAAREGEWEGEGEEEGECLPLPRFDGESAKIPRHPCACESATEPSVDVDQRERRVRSGSPPTERVEGIRRGAGLSGVAERTAESRTCERSTSKSNDEKGDAGVESVPVLIVCEYTLAVVALIGVVGHRCPGETRRLAGVSIGLSQ